MNRQEIVRKVAEKLQIDEDTVDAVYMHQTQAVSQNLKHPDINLIYFPALGSINFKVSKASDKLCKYIGRLKRWKARWDTLKDGKDKESFRIKINTSAELIKVFKYKVSLVSEKYNGIRMDFINRSLKYYANGRFVDFIDNLRKERENGFIAEIIPEPEKALAEQTGDTEGVSELLPVHDEAKEGDGQVQNIVMQKRYMRDVRPQG